MHNIISPTGAVARSNAVYGQGMGSVFLSTLQCIGNESSLTSCAGADFLDSSPCPHNRDAGVMCQRRQGKAVHAEPSQYVAFKV